jgi:hypothetical protein
MNIDIHISYNHRLTNDYMFSLKQIIFKTKGVQSVGPSE